MSIPTDERQNKTITLVLAVRYDNWFHLGSPVVLGGPTDTLIIDAYRDSETGKVVLSLARPSDRQIRAVLVVYRTDRYAKTAQDSKFVQRVRLLRQMTNHPFHLKLERIEETSPEVMFTIPLCVVLTKTDAYDLYKLIDPNGLPQVTRRARQDYPKWNAHDLRVRRFLERVGMHNFVSIIDSRVEKVDYFAFCL